MRAFKPVRLFLIGTMFVLLCLHGAPVRADAPAAGAPVSEAVAGAIDRLAQLTGQAPFQTTRIFDRHGNLLYELSDEGRRTIIAIDRAPKHLLDATVATEDKNFYAHAGVDYQAIARAAWQNWQAEEVVSGASTITQQLARSLLLDDSERYQVTMQRKLKEASIAVELEERFTKRQILEMYLNTVYYGHQAYGVAAAAETFLRKDVADLTLAESALLAGLPQSPVAYDPFINPAAARARQAVVLELMQRQGYISRAEREAALAEPLRLIPPALPVLRAPHFVDYVRALLMERYGSEGMRQGLLVHTSIDLRFQQLAQEIARAQIEEIGTSKRASNAAVVILRPGSGEVLAMVGSLDYYDAAIDGQVNMATSKRQPGSSIKPILYSAALERGWTPASVIWDTPTRYPLADGAWYTPSNITGQYYGPARLRFALANSLNVPAIKVLAQIGPRAMLDTAARLGITAYKAPATEYGLSLAVGGYELSLLELTNAFAILANGGVAAGPHPITSITDAAGRTMYQAQALAEPVQAVSPATAYQITSMLSDPRTRQVVFGRNSPLNTSQPTAVKTGTTDGWRDNLTVGYTRYVTVGVWLGNSDGKPMKDAIGSQTAGPIWHDIMETIWATPSLYPSLGFVGEPLPQGFAEPPGLDKAVICDLRGYNNSCPRAYEELFAAPESAVMASLSGEIEADLPQGYCLPDLDGSLPLSMQVHTRFVPLPANAGDRADARRWALKHNLALHTVDECSASLNRRPQGPLPLPEPERLIFIPETRPQPGGLWPGNRAIIIESIPGLNIRRQPGEGGLILGSLKRNQIAVLRQGPETSGGDPWFEVRVLQSGLVGWVNARFLRVLPPPEEGLDAQGEGDLAAATTASLRAGVNRLNMRAGPGLNNPVIGTARPGDQLAVNEGPLPAGEGAWYLVLNRTANTQGWVDGRYLILRAGAEGG